MPDSLRKILAPLASLKLTVLLFTLSIFLVFAGTLAQVHQGIWTVVGTYFRSFYVWIDLQIFAPTSIVTIPGSFPFPGGYVLGGLMLVNLLAAHAVRFKLTARRSGIILLHLGVILMLVGELVTALYAKEGNMTIDEGASVNYTENIREVELAIIDPSDAKDDSVVAVPESFLRDAANGKGSFPKGGIEGSAGKTIHNQLLPFDIVVDEYMTNSRLFGPKQAPPGSKPKATAGVGKMIVAEAQPEVTGVEAQQVNAPTALITLTKSGKNLGTFLVSLFIDQPDTITVDDKTYTINLRFRRTYKPYTLQLLDFKHDKFLGTNKPRNFSSLVRLTDPTQNEDRQVLIWMNHPLRYNGETFYQSAFKPGDGGTVLQVVRNPGWLLPYISCITVAVGMMIHFGVMLYDSLRRGNDATVATASASTPAAKQRPEAKR